ncbi:hypothetical protein ACH5RR_001488 [Cinchona calisaya]|uniref:Uncharacterized protein n=1 Tax=Cinchona calisaya TaxID=153742 RepID=A0ABD3B4Q8_9GENT
MKFSKESETSWKHVPNIKTFGKTLGFRFLDRKIRELWRPNGNMDVINIGHDFSLSDYTISRTSTMFLLEDLGVSMNTFLAIRLWVHLETRKELWKLKSIIDFLLWDDLNSKLLHITTIYRRNCNKIIALKNDAGVGISSDYSSKELISKSFQELCHSDMVCSILDSNSFPAVRIIVPKNDRFQFSVPSSELEIRKYAFDLKPFKSLIPDGLLSSRKF